MDARTVVFIHGIGGESKREEWLEPLNVWLADLGYEVIDPDLDTVIDPDYLPSLTAGTPGPKPEFTWTRPSEADAAQTWLDFLVRKEDLASAIDEVRNDPKTVSLGIFAGTPLPDWASNRLSRVWQYRHREAKRHAVWRLVLEALPEQGHVIVIAHSLGSIVMLDLLKRLPEGLHVDLLMTIGSPMGVSGLRRSDHGLGKAGEFPANRVGAWVNVFDPGDDVTVGTGASKFFPAALDAKVDTGGSHSLRAYMSNPVVAVAVAWAWSSPNPEASHENLPARPIHELWAAHLVRSAYRQSLALTCKTDMPKYRRCINAAREVLASRAISEAHRSYQEALRRVEALPEEDRQRQRDLLADSPFAPGSCPSEADLTSRPAHLVAGQLSESQLVDASIELLVGPFAPFDIEVSDAHAMRALTNLHARMHGTSKSATSDDDFARAVTAAMAEAEGVFRESGVPWTPILVGSGLLLLAATGVGLALAVPAGLAGAAAVTATLAAFGPGGMIGGIASIAALTGTGAALAAGGLGLKAADEHARIEQIREGIAVEIAMRMSAGQMRSLIVQWIAAVSARERLNLDSIAVDLEDYLLRMQVVINREVTLHRDLAPERPGTKDWRSKKVTVEKALDWLSKRSVSIKPELESRESVVKAIEADTEPGDPPVGSAKLRRGAGFEG